MVSKYETSAKQLAGKCLHCMAVLLKVISCKIFLTEIPTGLGQLDIRMCMVPSLRISSRFETCRKLKIVSRIVNMEKFQLPTHFSQFSLFCHYKKGTFRRYGFQQYLFNAQILNSMTVLNMSAFSRGYLLSARKSVPH